MKSPEFLLPHSTHMNSCRFLPTPVEVRRIRQLLADAVPFKPGTESLRSLSQMSRAEVFAICDAVGEAARDVLLEEVEVLRRAFDEMDRRRDGAAKGSKFQVLSAAPALPAHGV